MTWRDLVFTSKITLGPGQFCTGGLPRDCRPLPREACGAPLGVRRAETAGRCGGLRAAAAQERAGAETILLKVVVFHENDQGGVSVGNVNQYESIQPIGVQLCRRRWLPKSGGS